MNFDEYKNNLSCPIKPKRVCPKCRLQYGDLDNFCAGCGKDVRGYYKQEYSKYLEQVKKKYRKQDVELIEKFKYDSLSAIGLIDHPKSAAVFPFFARDLLPSYWPTSVGSLPSLVSHPDL